MKNFFILLLLTAITFQVFADNSPFRAIEKYETSDYNFKAQKAKDGDLILFTFINYGRYEKPYISTFYLLFSNWSDDTVKKIMRKMYLEEVQENGRFYDHKDICDLLNLYIQDFLPKSNYGLFYEFELREIVDEGDYKKYRYDLKL